MSEGQPIRASDTMDAIKTAESLHADNQRYPVALRTPVFDLVSNILARSAEDGIVTNLSQDQELVEDLATRFINAQGQLQGYNNVSFDQKIKVDVNQVELDHILSLMREVSQNGAGFPQSLVGEVAGAFARSKKKAQPGLFKRMVDKIIPTKKNRTQEAAVVDPLVLKFGQKRAEPGKFE